MRLLSCTVGLLLLPSLAHSQGLLSTQPQPAPQPTRPQPKVIQSSRPSNQPRVIDSDPVAVASTLVQVGKINEALKTLDRALLQSPKNTKILNARAGIRALAGLGELAKQDYDEVLTLDPKDSRAWHQRGWLLLTLGRPVDAVRDFDQALVLVPNQRPYDWQRGIACYYAGQFEEGKKQFELHQSVNSQDVENAVWHFLCVSRLEGVESARKRIIPITQDPRVPLAEVQALFAGTGSEEAVLTAAKERSGQRSKEAHFYAHLYLGLYFEALGQPEASAAHMLKATTDFDLPGLMGDVARAHRLLRSKPSSASTSPAASAASPK